MDDRAPLSIIRIMRDGPSMCALLGLNLQEGNAEFVSIEHPHGKVEQRAAGEMAARRLEARLKIAHLKLPRVFEGDVSASGADWWKD